MKTSSSLVLSCLVAFFPKCPLCWATYMSVLSGIGLSQIPYQKWLLPFFIALLGVQLYLLFKKIKLKGPGPILMSCAGYVILIMTKGLGLEYTSLVYAAVFLISIGAFWNSFTFSKTT